MSSSSSQDEALWDFPNQYLTCQRVLSLFRSYLVYHIIEISGCRFYVLFKSHNLAVNVLVLWLLQTFIALFRDVPWALVIKFNPPKIWKTKWTQQVTFVYLYICMHVTIMLKKKKNNGDTIWKLSKIWRQRKGNSGGVQDMTIRGWIWSTYIIHTYEMS